MKGFDSDPEGDMNSGLQFGLPVGMMSSAWPLRAINSHLIYFRNSLIKLNLRTFEQYKTLYSMLIPTLTDCFLSKNLLRAWVLVHYSGRNGCKARPAYRGNKDRGTSGDGQIDIGRYRSPAS